MGLQARKTLRAARPRTLIQKERLMLKVRPTRENCARPRRRARHGAALLHWPARAVCNSSAVVDCDDGFYAGALGAGRPGGADAGRGRAGGGFATIAPRAGAGPAAAHAIRALYCRRTPRKFRRVVSVSAAGAAGGYFALSGDAGAGDCRVADLCADCDSGGGAGGAPARGANGSRGGRADAFWIVDT